MRGETYTDYARFAAERYEEAWAQLMPLTHAAFVANGRVAP